MNRSFKLTGPTSGLWFTLVLTAATVSSHFQLNGARAEKVKLLTLPGGHQAGID